MRSAYLLFRRRGKTAVLKLRFQPRLLGGRLLDVGLLDVPEAADGLRHARKARQQRDLRSLQSGDPLIDHRKIVLDQLPLGLALLGAPERIERAAAQKLELRQHPERVDHPAAKLLLLEMTRRGIALCEDRRGQVELQREI